MSIDHIGSPEWKRTRKQILIRDGYACLKCGKRKDLQVNHIDARFDGGDDNLDNLATLCQDCHREWHLLVESHVAWHVWLKLPPVAALVILFSQPDGWSDQITAKEFRETVIQAAGTLRELYSQELIDTEE